MSDPILCPTTGSHYAPSLAEHQRLRRVAGGLEPADLILRGGQVLMLHTGEILQRDVVIAGRHIAAVTPVGRLQAAQEIDARGRYIAPGFIDVHLHIEYTKLTPGELARLSIPRGTTTVFGDANCMANVCGAAGLDFMGSTSTPLRIFRQVSSQVPGAPHLGTSGGSLSTEEIVERVQRPEAVTFGESSPYDLSDTDARKRVAALSAMKRQTGHTALMRDEPLWSYFAGGVGDDHNAFLSEDVIERLRMGAVLTVMSGSMNDNTPLIFQDIAAYGEGLRSFTFCADDKYAEDLDGEGHIDHHVRTAIACGVPVMDAWRMATLNAAQYYRLDHLIGAVTPSRLADLQIVADLSDPRPSHVFMDGKLVAQDGKPLFVNDDPIPEITRDTIRLSGEIGPSSFAVRSNAGAVWVQAIEMYDGYFKRAFHVQLPVIEGAVQSDPARDLLKVAIVDRHHATPSVGLGYVKGFGLTRGAMAASTSCDTMNIVAVGEKDADIALAVDEVAKMGGGLVCVADGEVLGAVPLAVGGCVSDQPYEVVVAQSRALYDVVRALGCDMRAPFMIMSFIGLTVVPDLGMTERGLVDTRTQTLIDLILQEQADGTVMCRCTGHAHQVHKDMDPHSYAPA